MIHNAQAGRLSMARCPPSHWPGHLSHDLVTGSLTEEPGRRRVLGAIACKLLLHLANRRRADLTSRIRHTVVAKMHPCVFAINKGFPTVKAGPVGRLCFVVRLVGAAMGADPQSGSVEPTNPIVLTTGRLCHGNLIHSHIKGKRYQGAAPAFPWRPTRNHPGLWPRSTLTG
jgi:hypothetical protein